MGTQVFALLSLMQKYNAAKAVIEELEQAGAAVRYSVDATRLVQCLAVGEWLLCNGKSTECHCDSRITPSPD